MIFSAILIQYISLTDGQTEGHTEYGHQPISSTALMHNVT